MSLDSSDDDCPLVSLPESMSSNMSSDLSDDDRPLVRCKTRRDEFLSCPFLETQAKEEIEGKSASCSINSDDDAEHSNLSYVSSGSQHSNAEINVYLASLSSQAVNEGWQPPMNCARRSKVFRY
jgi:hypothetical protein